jgi:hypothetical protein
LIALAAFPSAHADRLGPPRDGQAGRGTSALTPSHSGTVANVTPNASAAVVDRGVERRGAVALARHYREFDGLAVRQIADRLGRSPATVKAHFYEPSDANKRPSDRPTR